MRSLLLLEQRLERFGRLAPEGVPVYAASNDLMRSITGFAVHRGVLASFDRKPLPSADELVHDAHRVVVLEDVNNHTNVGAIVRSASALGIDALLLDPGSCDPLYRRSLRISMGEALSLPHARSDPLPAGLAPLRAAGFVLVALTPDAGAVDIAEVAAAGHERLALLLGAEGAGLSPAVLAEVDVRARIPLAAGVDSLNVAAAAAIAFYALRPAGV
jgi:tRNA G18 (ribose-2'-O)-methylase SpoU